MNRRSWLVRCVALVSCGRRALGLDWNPALKRPAPMKELPSYEIEEAVVPVGLVWFNNGHYPTVEHVVVHGWVSAVGG